MRRSLALTLLIAAALAAGPAQGAARPAGGTWIGGVTLSEYWPVPERWFRGRLVSMPGVGGLHRVDWLYSGVGLLMEADGVGLDGKRYHVDSFGDERWVDARGEPTTATASGVWTRGDPAWCDGGWRNAAGAVTFPLETGGWAHGEGMASNLDCGVRFARGPSLPLRYYESVATDPSVIAKGSLIYIPAYRKVNGGWFVAADTGTGIIGRHIDVFRPPPRGPDAGRFLRNQRVRVIPPKRT